MDILAEFDKLLKTYSDHFDDGHFNRQLKVRNQVGVSALIGMHYKSLYDPKYGEYKNRDYSIEIDKNDYEVIKTDIPVPEYKGWRAKDDSDESLLHNELTNCLHKSAILGRAGYRCITQSEVTVGDKDLVVFKPGSDMTLTPLGMIDFMCLNEQGDLVIGDTKTSPRYYHEYTLEKLFLKQDHVRQLHIYGKLFDFMAKKHDLKLLRISHFLIFGLYNPKSAPKGFEPKMGLWKIKYNPKKWLDGYSSNKDLTFLTIDFAEIKPVQKKLPRYGKTATLDKSITGSREIGLYHDRFESKYFLIDESTSAILKTFKTVYSADEWIVFATEEEIEAMYKGKQERLVIQNLYS